MAANSGSKTISYADPGKHDADTDEETHEHKKKTIKKKAKGKDGKIQIVDVEVLSIKYNIPAANFTDEDNWKSGSFY